MQDTLFEHAKMVIRKARRLSTMNASEVKFLHQELNEITDNKDFVNLEATMQRDLKYLKRDVAVHLMPDCTWSGREGIKRHVTT